MWLLAPCPWILASRRKTIAWAECSELLLSMHDLELCPVPLHWHPAHTGTHPLQDKQAQRLPYCLFLILSAHTSTLETNSWDDIWAFQVWAFQVLHRLTWAVASKCFSLLIYLQSSFVGQDGQDPGAQLGPCVGDSGPWRETNPHVPSRQEAEQLQILQTPQHHEETPLIIWPCPEADQQRFVGQWGVWATGPVYLHQPWEKLQDSLFHRLPANSTYFRLCLSHYVLGPSPHFLTLQVSVFIPAS